MTFKADAIRLVDEWQNATSDREVSVQELLVLMNRLTKALASAIEEMNGLASLNDLIVDCEDFYDTHIGSIDLEGVGPWLEPYADMVVRAQIRPTIQELAERIHV